MEAQERGGFQAALDDRIGRMDQSGWQKKAQLLINGQL